MDELNVGILGWGAIGSAVGRRLLAGAVDGAALAGIATRRPVADAPVEQLAVDALAARSDLIVEAAGQHAIAEHGPTIVESGCRLLIVSTGALRDGDLFDRLRSAPPGRVLASTGAIGGLDLLSACRFAGAIEAVRLTTTKPPPVLVQPWMDAAMTSALEAGDAVIECFAGPATEAARLFPSSVNVAATLALAAGSWEAVEVTVVGDPAATGNRHHIEISADAGRYAIDVANEPLADNPASSALVVASVLRAIASLTPTPLRVV